MHEYIKVVMKWKEALCIVLYMIVKRIIEKEKRIGTWCVGLWPLYSKMYANFNKSLHSIVRNWRVLCRLNVWRSLPYVTKEKSVIFTGRLIYGIFIKNYKVKKKPQTYAWMNCSQYDQ